MFFIVLIIYVSRPKEFFLQNFTSHPINHDIPPVFLHTGDIFSMVPTNKQVDQNGLGPPSGTA